MALLSEQFFGLLVTVAAAKYMGAGRELDMALLALAVPMALGSVFETVSYVALLPFFARELVVSGGAGAWRFANRTLNMVAFSLGALSAIYIVLLPSVTRLLARGYPESDLVATTFLGVLATPFFLCRGVSGTLSAFLMTRGAVWAAFGRMSIRSFIRLAAFLLLYRVTSGAVAFVAANTIGNVLAVLAAIPPFCRLREGLRYRLWDLVPAETLRGVLSQVGGQTLVVAMTSSILVIERSLASGLSVGMVANLNYARTLGLFPSVVGRSAASALFPRIAKEAAGDRGRVGITVWRGLRAILFLTIPVAVVLSVVREPAVTLLYRRGQFTASDVSAVASILPLYLAASVLNSLAFLLNQVLLAAMQPALVARRESVSWGLYLLCALVFVYLLGVWGLALAVVVRDLASSALLLGAARGRRLFAAQRPFAQIATTLLAATAGGLGGLVAYRSVCAVGPVSSALGSALQIAAAFAGCCAVYLGLAWFTNRDEIRQLVSLVKRPPAAR